MEPLSSDVARLFAAKEQRRRKLAGLPFPEKVRAVVQLQRMAAPILRARGRQVRAWNIEEAKRAIEVVCPCCQARLTVDPELGAVLRHEPPPKEAAVTDLKAAVEELKGEAGRRGARFKESMEAEKEKGKLLERKFKELLKKAKDEPVTRPTRDIDLD